MPLRWELRKQRFDVQFSEALELQRRGMWHKAAGCYTNALKYKECDVNALLGRSRCYVLMGKLELALADAESVIIEEHKEGYDRLRYGTHRGLLQKADTLYARGDFEEALLCYHSGNAHKSDVQGFRDGIKKAEAAIYASLNAAASASPHAITSPTTQGSSPRPGRPSSPLRRRSTVSGPRRSRSSFAPFGAGLGSPARTPSKSRRMPGMGNGMFAHMLNDEVDLFGLKAGLPINDDLFVDPAAYAQSRAGHGGGHSVSESRACEQDDNDLQILEAKLMEIDRTLGDFRDDITFVASLAGADIFSDTANLNNIADPETRRNNHNDPANRNIYVRRKCGRGLTVTPHAPAEGSGETDMVPHVGMLKRKVGAAGLGRTPSGLGAGGGGNSYAVLHRTHARRRFCLAAQQRSQAAQQQGTATHASSQAAGGAAGGTSLPAGGAAPPAPGVQPGGGGQGAAGCSTISSPGGGKGLNLHRRHRHHRGKRYRTLARWTAGRAVVKRQRAVALRDAFEEEECARILQALTGGAGGGGGGDASGGGGGGGGSGSGVQPARPKGHHHQLEGAPLPVIEITSCDGEPVPLPEASCRFGGSGRLASSGQGAPPALFTPAPAHPSSPLRGGGDKAGQKARGGAAQMPPPPGAPQSPSVGGFRTEFPGSPTLHQGQGQQQQHHHHHPQNTSSSDRRTYIPGVGPRDIGALIGRTQKHNAAIFRHAAGTTSDDEAADGQGPPLSETDREQKSMLLRKLKRALSKSRSTAGGGLSGLHGISGLFKKRGGKGQRMRHAHQGGGEHLRRVLTAGLVSKEQNGRSRDMLRGLLAYFVERNRFWMQHIVGGSFSATSNLGRKVGAGAATPARISASTAPAGSIASLLSAASLSRTRSHSEKPAKLSKTIPVKGFHSYAAPTEATRHRDEDSREKAQQRELLMAEGAGRGCGRQSRRCLNQEFVVTVDVGTERAAQLQQQRDMQDLQQQQQNPAASPSPWRRRSTVAGDRKSSSMRGASASAADLASASQSPDAKRQQLFDRIADRIEREKAARAEEALAMRHTPQEVTAAERDKLPFAAAARRSITPDRCVMPYLHLERAEESAILSGFALRDDNVIHGADYVERGEREGSTAAATRGLGTPQPHSRPSSGHGRSWGWGWGGGGASDTPGLTESAGTATPATRSASPCWRGGVGASPHGAGPGVPSMVDTAYRFNPSYAASRGAAVSTERRKIASYLRRHGGRGGGGGGSGGGGGGATSPHPAPPPRPASAFAMQGGGGGGGGAAAATPRPPESGAPQQSGGGPHHHHHHPQHPYSRGGEGGGTTGAAASTSPSHARRQSELQGCQRRTTSPHAHNSLPGSPHARPATALESYYVSRSGVGVGGGGEQQQQQQQQHTIPHLSGRQQDCFTCPGPGGSRGGVGAGGAFGPPGTAAPTRAAQTPPLPWSGLRGGDSPGLHDDSAGGGWGGGRSSTAAPVTTGPMPRRPETSLDGRCRFSRGGGGGRSVRASGGPRPSTSMGRGCGRSPIPPRPGTSVGDRPRKAGRWGGGAEEDGGDGEDGGVSEDGSDWVPPGMRRVEFTPPPVQAEVVFSKQRGAKAKAVVGTTAEIQRPNDPDVWRRELARDDSTQQSTGPGGSEDGAVEAKTTSFIVSTLAAIHSCIQCSDLYSAVQLAERLLEQMEDLIVHNASRVVSDLCGLLGTCHLATCDYPRARHYFTRQLVLCKKSTNPAGYEKAVAQLATTYQMGGAKVLAPSEPLDLTLEACQKRRASCRSGAAAAEAVRRVSRSPGVAGARRSCVGINTADLTGETHLQVDRRRGSVSPSACSRGSASSAEFGGDCSQQEALEEPDTQSESEDGGPAS